MFPRIISTAITIGCGLIVLLSLLLPAETLAAPRRFLLQWAMVLGGFAFILAYLNIFRVHLLRLARGKRKKITSLLLMLSALATTAVVVLQGPQGMISQAVLKYVMIPGESTLLALTTVTLLLASIRVLRHRRSTGSIAFVLIAALALVLTVPYADAASRPIEIIRQWLHIPAMAGMRGLMMGIALGTTMTGLRIIIGADRPQSGE